MAAGEYSIYAEEGVERSFTVSLLDTSNMPIDLRNTDLKLFIKRKFNDCSSILETKLTKTDAVNGEFIFKIPSDCFIGLVSKPRSPKHKEDFVYEVVAFEDNKPTKRWLQGVVSVAPKVGDYE